MECLADYIGVRTCKESEIPASGLYINSLAGISLQSIEASANEEQRHFMGVWEDVEARGLAKFALEFEALLRTRYDLLEGCTVTDLICDNKDRLKVALWYYLGVEILTERIYSGKLNYWTLTKDTAKSLRAEYEAEYQAAVNLAIDNFDCGDCLKDEGLISYRPTRM